MVAADADDARMPEAAALEDGEIGRATADVDNRHPELFLIGHQHCFARGELFDDRVDHADAGAIDARDNVLRGRRAPRHDVDVHFEPRTGHPHRRANAVLVIDDEVLRQHVENLAPGRKGHGLGGVDGAPHVVAGDFAVLARDRDDPAAVEAFDVRPRDGQVHRVDLDTGHQLGFVDRVLDGIDGRFEIDDGAAPDAFGLGDADADDLEAAVIHHLCDDGRHFRGANVQPDQISLSIAHIPPSPSASLVFGALFPVDGRSLDGLTYTRASNRRST